MAVVQITIIPSNRPGGSARIISFETEMDAKETHQSLMVIKTIMEHYHPKPHGDSAATAATKE